MLKLITITTSLVQFWFLAAGIVLLARRSSAPAPSLAKL
jgi:hypothetical protein